MNMSTNNSVGLIEGCVPMGETDPRAFLSDDVRWETLEKRDSLVCGEFVYGVLTTGCIAGLPVHLACLTVRMCASLKPARKPNKQVFVPASAANRKTRLETTRRPASC